MQLYIAFKLFAYPSVTRNNLRVFTATALSERKQILPSPFPSEGSFSIGGMCVWARHLRSLEATCAKLRQKTKIGEQEAIL